MLFSLTSSLQKCTLLIANFITLVSFWGMTQRSISQWGFLGRLKRAPLRWPCCLADLASPGSLFVQAQHHPRPTGSERGGSWRDSILCFIRLSRVRKALPEILTPEQESSLVQHFWQRLPGAFAVYFSLVSPGKAHSRETFFTFTWLSPDWIVHQILFEEWHHS